MASPTGRIARELGINQVQVQRAFDRRTGELNGSLSGSARFTLLPTDYAKRSIFALA
jgi:hypothetical protein